MTAAHEFDYGTLSWVKSEIDQTLDQARKVLETYADDPQDGSQLRFCINHLHQVHGTLQMVEIYGAALAAEEMEALAVALSAGETTNRDEALEVLMRGILQLPDYLERLQKGQKDMPMVLLPLLNDLRAARRAQLLSENALFSPDLDIAAPPVKNTGDMAEDLRARAKRLRHTYHTGLLGLFRDRDRAASLTKLASVIQQLRQVARVREAAQLLWVAGGLAEALTDEGIEPSVAVKLLLGHVDREVKRIIDFGEEALTQVPPQVLVKNLLYYVGRAASNGAQVSALKQAFRLAEQLPDEGELEKARAGLSAPNAALLKTVTDALRETLDQVKEQLDVFVRSTERDREQLRPLRDMLHQLADTLVMLGVGAQRQTIQAHIAMLDAMISGERAIADEPLMQMAGELLAVEATLDDVAAGESGDAEASGDAEVSHSPRMVQTVIAEARTELARIKEAVSAYSQAPDEHDLLSEVPAALQGVRGSLAMLDMERAAELVTACRDYIQQELIEARAAPEPAAMESLADALTSIEYYLESVGERWGSPKTILEAAAETIGGLARGEAAEPGLVLEDPAPESREENPVAPPTETETGEGWTLDWETEAGAPEGAAGSGGTDTVPGLDWKVSDPSEEDSAGRETPADLSLTDLLPGDEGVDDGARSTEAGGGSDAGGLDWDGLELDEGAQMTSPSSGSGDEPTPPALDLPDVDSGAWDLAWGTDAEPEPEITIEPLAEASLSTDDGASEPTEPAVGWDETGADGSEIPPARLAEVLDLVLLDPSDQSATRLFDSVIGALIASSRARGREEVVGHATALQAAVRDLAARNGADLDMIGALYAKRDAVLDAIARGAEAGTGGGRDWASEPIELEPAAPASGTDAEQVPAYTAPVESGVEPEIDEEIIEIFLEEAAEELENISRLLPLWRANPAEHEARGDLRRSFHTLKGSGRLVGAKELGEFAWAFENMLNRVIDGAVAAGPSMFALLDEARDALPQLFELFKSGGHAGPAILGLEDRAHALSRGEAPESQDAAAPTPEADETNGPEAAEPDPGAAAGRSETPTEPTASGLGPDLVLLDIYRKESEGHLETLREAVAACRTRGGGCPVSEALARAVHTLRGSSRTAGVGVVAEISTDLEHYVKLLQERSLPLSAAALQVIEDTVELVMKTMDRLESPDAFVVEGEALRARVAVLFEDAQAAAAPRTTDSPAAGTVEVDTAGGAAFDDDLLDIFLEEGAEILDSSDHTLHQWLNAPDDAQLLEQLQRDLHTLKGGARMAGIAAIGDLSHSLESLLTAVAEGHLSASAHMFDILQQAQDRLVNMLEQVKQHQPVAAATDLLALLDGFLGRELAGEEEAGEDLDYVEAEETASSLPEAAPVASDEPVAEPVPEAASPGGTELVPHEHEGEVDSAALPTPAADEDADRPKQARVQHEQVRVRADLLDNLVNFAGEVSIYRSRLEQQVNVFRFDLHELDETTARLRDQLRNFEIETEAQIQYRYEDSGGNTNYEEFDPLEFDRFTTMQQLSRSMMESLNDLDSLRNLLGNATRESETLLLQQARVNTELQEGLMRARMVPFASQAPRLRRIVRQACSELGKRAELRFIGEDHELDRQVLDRIMAPLEHMLRNAVAHGIEAPGVRRNAGKPEAGSITMELGREGSEVVIRVSDDGGGINFDAIRDKAVKRGLIAPEARVNEAALLDMILESGFSTAAEVTQIAGRGVGMDVVNSEIKQLGGTLQMESVRGRSTRFTVRLPLTLSVTRALVVSVGEEQFALPLLSVQGVERLTHEEIQELLAQERPTYEWVGEPYRFLHLGSVMGTAEPMLPGPGRKLPVLITRSGEYRAALLVEGLQGSREIVVKSVGPQLSTLRGISGATITGEGEVQLILDLGVLSRLGLAQDGLALTESVEAQTPVVHAARTVLVVDDSITVRKVTTRLLERNDYKVFTAKDGVDALAQLDEVQPDLILLDIEMPRMDGFELATNIRNSERLRHIPIIMITSRVADKHRQRAMQIGVNRYMGKPFQEHDLLANITAELDGR